MVCFEQIKMEQTWLLRNFKRNIIILKMVANYVSYQNYFKYQWQVPDSKACKRIEDVHNLLIKKLGN